jgi:RNA polymerase sigma-70 factor (ECF subfamily)
MQTDSIPDLRSLIERIAQRDQLALAELYDSTSAFVFGLARRILTDVHRTQDVTQEVYLQVWQEACRYNAERGTPRTWLHILTRTRALDQLRSEKKYANQHTIDHDIVADTSPGIEETLVTNSRRATIVAALNRLSPAQRKAIELAFYSGLSHSEIALKLTQPIGTVKNHIRLGMLKLREHLGAHRGDL